LKATGDGRYDLVDTMETSNLSHDLSTAHLRVATGLADAAGRVLEMAACDGHFGRDRMMWGSSHARLVRSRL
jgi:hypothetical protein